MDGFIPSKLQPDTAELALSSLALDLPCASFETNDTRSCTLDKGRSSQSFDLFTFCQSSHAASLIQNSRAFRILSGRIAVDSTKFNSTLKIHQDRAPSAIAIELQLRYRGGLRKVGGGG